MFGRTNRFDTISIDSAYTRNMKRIPRHRHVLRASTSKVEALVQYYPSWLKSASSARDNYLKLVSLLAPTLSPVTWLGDPLARHISALPPCGIKAKIRLSSLTNPPITYRMRKTPLRVISRPRLPIKALVSVKSKDCIITIRTGTHLQRKGCYARLSLLHLIDPPPCTHLILATWPSLLSKAPSSPLAKVLSP